MTMMSPSHRTRLFLFVSGSLSCCVGSFSFPSRGFQNPRTASSAVRLVSGSLRLAPDNFLESSFPERRAQPDVAAQRDFQPQPPRPVFNEDPGQPLARIQQQQPQVEQTRPPFATESPSHPPTDTKMVGLQPDQRPDFVGLQPDQELFQDWNQNDMSMSASSTQSSTSTVQGNSRKTWSSLPPQTSVQVSSEGRPVSANVEVWQGPNNVPSKMKIYSEDGAMRPWNAAFATVSTNGGSPSLDVKNTGQLEYPTTVTVSNNNPPINNNQHYQQQQQQQDGSSTDNRDTVERSNLRDNNGSYSLRGLGQTETIHSDNLGYFSLSGNTERVAVEVYSEGLPIYATVELWQGPGNMKQVAEIYSDNGLTRPWQATIETPGYECTLAINNVGPMVYPLTASVVPL